MKKISLIMAMIFVFISAFSVFSFAAETVNGGYVVLSDENNKRLVAAGETLAK
jgi:hypothetical protein